MVYYIFKEFQGTTVRDRVAEIRGDRRKRRENFNLSRREEKKIRHNY